MARIPLAALAVLLLIACESKSELRAVAHDTLAAPDTLVTQDSDLLLSALDMTAGGERVWVADALAHRLLVVHESGSDVHTIGRQGAGPGEFSRPTALRYAGGRLWVLDSNNGRVQVLDHEGRHAATFPAPTMLLHGSQAFNEQLQLATGTGGVEDALVAVYDSLGQRVRTFGQPVAPAPGTWDFGAMKFAIQRGEMPPQFRNRVLPVWGEDGTLFVVLTGDLQALRFAAHDSLLWSRPLDDPAIAAARAFFMAENARQPSGRIVPPRFVNDARLVGSELWILLGTNEQEHGVLIGLSVDQGTLRRRIVLRGLPAARVFTVNAARTRLYVAAPDDGILVSYALPAAWRDQRAR